MRGVWIAVIAAAASTVAFARIASAADIEETAVKAPPPVVAPVFSWAGFYIGANAGAVWSSDPITMTASDFFHSQASISADGSPTLTQTGFTGGLQAGYNWQLSLFVLGLETDFNYTNIRGSQTITRGAVPGLPLGYTISESVKSEWLWTLRPRIGLALEYSLIYATGGLAVGNVEFSQSSLFPDCPAAGCPLDGSVSKTHAGWTVGGGWQYAVLGGPWSVKLEYLYTNLGKLTFADSESAFGFATAAFTHQAKFTEQIARLGLNYRFLGP
jgi:outer membrane immunogenic protein